VNTAHNIVHAGTGLAFLAGGLGSAAAGYAAAGFLLFRKR
jgi:hypothetical protein